MTGAVDRRRLATVAAVVVGVAAVAVAGHAGEVVVRPTPVGLRVGELRL